MTVDKIELAIDWHTSVEVVAKISPSLPHVVCKKFVIAKWTRKWAVGVAGWSVALPEGPVDKVDAGEGSVGVAG